MIHVVDQFSNGYLAPGNIALKLGRIISRGQPVNILSVSKVSDGGLWSVTTFSRGMFPSLFSNQTERKFILVGHANAER